ncbi:hypothetical protein [Mycobacterium sp. Marseille-P9652]|uniref:hypothetical protein n=1 Tax=Mycobacterium sp. Marseille-P9652 TaxID=2654950 RepID=UPI0012E7C089|nr:hypothetical protein [Mycobacterium sp. Marseille-P9652]
MLWIALVLVLLCIALLVVGLVAYANGAGVAPHHRTEEDPTGIRRAGSRVAWSDVFRRMPSSLNTFVDKEASREDRLTALGSLAVLGAVLAGCAAVLALIAAMV